MKYNPQFEEDAKELSPGEYEAVVESVKEKTSTTGKPMLTWKLSITTPGYAGKPLWHNTVLAGGGSGMLKHFLKCIDSVYDGGEFDADDYIGETVGVRLIDREWDGKTIVSIGDVFPANSIPQQSEFNEEDLPF